MGSPPEIEVRFDPRLDARTPAYDPRPQVEVLDDLDDHHSCGSETSSHPGDSEETTAKVVNHVYLSSDESDSEGNVSQVSD